MKEFLNSLYRTRNTKIVRCVARAPYDGCWWEPNYWLYHKKRLHPIYVSGGAYKWFGFDKMRGAHEIVTTGVSVIDFCHHMEEGMRAYEDHEILDFDDVDWNPNVLNSATVICMMIVGNERDKKGKPLLPRWECSMCSQECVGRARFLGYQGNGGIGVVMTDPCCSDCFGKIKWCDLCFSFVVPKLPDDKFNIEGQESLPHVDMDRDLDEDDLVCPNCSCEDSNHHGEKSTFSDPEDEAENFGLTGLKFLGPDGDAEGLEGISIVIMQKGTD